MAASIHLFTLHPIASPRPKPHSISSSPLAFSSPSALLGYPRVSTSAYWRRRDIRHRATAVSSIVSAFAVRLSEVELLPIPDGAGGLESAFPSGAGVYGVYDKNGDLQFIGVTRNIAASVATHQNSVPDLCCSVKVGLVEAAESDRTVLTDAWKSWMEEHLAATGKIPPGNESTNNTWVRRPQRKPDIRLTPGSHVQLTIPIEELIDKLVKEIEVVAFIKGSRSAPQCGFSQRVVGILEAHGVDYESVDVLDEEHNRGLREALKIYSNWPTIPQVFVRGEFIGGCDIISSMAEKGELAALFQK